MASAIAAATAPPTGAQHSVLLLRRANDYLAAALRARYRVLSFYDSGGAPLPAFLAASAAAEPEAPRAALVVGVDAAFLVAGAGEVFSTDVADHAIGLLIDVLRNVSAADRYVCRGLWPVQGDYPLGSKLGGKRVGIIGLGSIGSSIAKRLKAFGFVIQYHSRRPKDGVSFRYFHDVISLATESDALIVACALNDQTRHIVNKEVLRALGKDGVVVNIARGGNIDEAELISMLREGKIAGAGLDVFEKEPVVPPEFFSMDNVVLTAHEAVFTTESGSDLCDLMIGNLEAFFDGRPLLTPVPPK
ncbi:glyoxylate/hydroxypyruvate reductase HPR3-like [Lolium rigidum]|uniref:glyoxylate/hydroxypyruvate reductase HPR3-like n=1 Tax=Lolium rigidum TaxID=89674 RepID=UPI001F5DDD9D|nr:glyoxylate/hydroxypyruvate reductase HPR3-like [Lolium rigidum]